MLTKGREPTAMQFTGGTLFVGHCTKFMFVHNQESLGAGKALVAKQTFESTLKSFGFAVSNYHGDNGVFKTQTFMDDCNTNLHLVALVHIIKMEWHYVLFKQ